MGKDNQVLDIGSRLELFVDRYLIDRLEGTELRMHHPQRMPRADSPLSGGYTTVIKDGGLFKGYYRSKIPGYQGEGHDGHPGEITCYAESRDGHEWNLPELGLHEIDGSRANNAILAHQSPFSHNFSPLLDTRPGVDKTERFKALAGIFRSTNVPPGLHYFASEDGIRWKKMRDDPVITVPKTLYNAFDSQNVAFWSEVENRYVCCFRTFELPDGGRRMISRTTSDDFLRWTPYELLEPNLPEEHLYTNNTHPYFRAPHIYIALPTRFMPNRGSSTEILFMSSRGGAPYERLFTEGFIRPGLEPERWGNRANYVALNVVPTGPGEMSIYHNGGYRYTLRTDGFVSVNAPFDGGGMTTRQLTFSGSELVLNCSTGAAGSIRVEIKDKEGIAVPGFELEACDDIVCDRIEQVVTWKGKQDVSPLAGKSVRLVFAMKDADLYSLGFR